MGIREITGYIAQFLLGVYWLWVVLSTAPQLRRNSRDRQVRGQILLIKTAAVALTTLLVCVIHYWATQWWHVIAATVGAAVLGRLLNRTFRRIVNAPRHRRRLTQRARTFERNYREMSRPSPLAGKPANGQRSSTGWKGRDLRRLSAPIHRHAR